MPILGSFSSLSRRGFNAGGAAGLYEFINATFATGGTTGYAGPSLSTARTALTGTGTDAWKNNTEFFTTTNGIQVWVVPVTGTYTINTYGSWGGGTGYSTPGYGARMQGDFALTQGTKIFILVGQPGLSSLASGGGGGTFVAQGTAWDASSTLLIAAGGGGGYGNSGGGSINAVTGTSGTSGNGANYAGGSNGQGGTTAANTGWGGAGAGWLSASGDGGNYGGIAPRVQTNGQGSSGPVTSSGQVGGFGGGGGGGANGGGGGGGYSGGGTSGGGGGSFAGGTNQVNVAGANAGPGFVVITKL